MTYNMYAFRDALVGYMAPFLQSNDNQAIRTLRTAVNDPASVMAASPKDYDLWQVGTYDDQAGLISNTQPRHVANAIDLKETRHD